MASAWKSNYVDESLQSSQRRPASSGAPVSLVWQPGVMLRFPHTTSAWNISENTAASPGPGAVPHAFSPHLAQAPWGPTAGDCLLISFLQVGGKGSWPGDTGSNHHVLQDEHLQRKSFLMVGCLKAVLLQWGEGNIEISLLALLFHMVLVVPTSGEKERKKKQIVKGEIKLSLFTDGLSV